MVSVKLRDMDTDGYTPRMRKAVVKNEPKSTETPGKSSRKGRVAAKRKAECALAPAVVKVEKLTEEEIGMACGKSSGQRKNIEEKVEDLPQKSGNENEDDDAADVEVTKVARNRTPRKAPSSETQDSPEMECGLEEKAENVKDEGILSSQAETAEYVNGTEVEGGDKTCAQGDVDELPVEGSHVSASEQFVDDILKLVDETDHSYLPLVQVSDNSAVPLLGVPENDAQGVNDANPVETLAPLRELELSVTETDKCEKVKRKKIRKKKQLGADAVVKGAEKVGGETGESMTKKGLSVNFMLSLSYH